MDWSEPTAIGVIVIAMIDLVFTLFLRGHDQAYAMGLACVYSSIRQRTKAELRLHVLVDETLSADVKNKFLLMTRGSDQILFYATSALPDVQDLAFSFDSRFSPAIVWRLWLADYLVAIRRCVLLDCDLLFNADIEEIWNLELGDNILSAPLRGHPHPPALHEWLQVEPEKYFRACCCLINLDKLRSSRAFLENRKLFLIESWKKNEAGLPQAGLLEQSVLNRYFSTLCKPLPISVIPVERINNHPKRSEWEAILLSGRDHILDIKGWQSRSPYSLKFWSLLLDTPWRNESFQFYEKKFS